MDSPNFLLIGYSPKYAKQTVKMWRDSKEQAIGQKEIHNFEDHIDFLNHSLSKQYQVDLALMENKVVGMIAYNKREINQLYIHVDYQGIGIGEFLLNRSKGQSSGKLTVHTFEVNKRAQKFYEKNGFEFIGRGHENEENLPDFQYEWKSE